MCYNENRTHKKRKIAHPWVFRGAVCTPFVLAQGLRAQRNSLSPHPRPLTTAVFARTTGKLPEHLASANAKSRNGVWWHWGFYRYLDRGSSRQ